MGCLLAAGRVQKENRQLTVAYHSAGGLGRTASNSAASFVLTAGDKLEIYELGYSTFTLGLRVTVLSPRRIASMFVTRARKFTLMGPDNTGAQAPLQLTIRPTRSTFSLTQPS